MEDYRDLSFYYNIPNPREYYMKRSPETHRKAGRNFPRSYKRKLTPPKHSQEYNPPKNLNSLRNKS